MDLARRCLQGAVAGVFLAAVGALRVDFQDDLSSYFVSHHGALLFKADCGIAVFLDGAWQSQTTESLRLREKKMVSGKDLGLGRYHGIELSWLAGPGSTPFVTTVKSYESGFDVAFEYRFPSGAQGTSLVDYQPNATRDDVITNFPAFNNIALPNSLSWSGSFVQPVTGMSKGPTGGPTVFFRAADPELKTVVVGSAINHFKASSAGPGITWDGTRGAWVPGTTATIRNLEPGFCHKFLLHLGRHEGITAAVSEWGAILQRLYRTYKIPDVTLTTIGYQTDNGAAYTFCTGNCTLTLLRKMKELNEIGVPMGYLSFQGRGASLPISSEEERRAQYVAKNGAPWCIDTWGPDLQNGTNEYPVSLKEFQRALGIPLQLYAPYFCPSSPYFYPTNASSPWRSIFSNSTLDGCDSFDFQNVEPSQSRAFYEWLFAKGRNVGMLSFEPDFMNQNYICVPCFIHSATKSPQFLHAMADAALDANLTIQWCYASPTDVLESLAMPSVTNFRVSFDFCYGESWNIGTSSLLVWALGAFPSKDTLWTTDNNRLIVPGCTWTPDHEGPAAELHLVLALMSMGPVGISDALGFSNATLLKRAITQNGTLLKPSKSITTVDSFLALGNKAPKGHVYGTYSTVGEVTVHQLVSFQLESTYSLNPLDLFPPVDSATRTYVYRRFGSTCNNGTNATSCVSVVKAEALASILLPRADFENETNGNSFSPTTTTIWPVCEDSGWVVLGDLGKYVPLSPIRFVDVNCTLHGADFEVKGIPGEVVPVTILTNVLSSEAEVLVLRLRLPADLGNLSVRCQYNDCIAGHNKYAANV